MKNIPNYAFFMDKMGKCAKAEIHFFMKGVNNMQKALLEGYGKEYYITEEAKVYDAATHKEVAKDRNSYILKAIDGSKVKRSYRKLYKDAFGKAWCIDEVQNLEGEEWRAIPNVKDYYCSNKGRIKSYNGFHAIIRKPYINNSGYYKIDLAREGEDPLKIYVHQVVAACWLQQPLQKPLTEYEIHHLNGKLDNRAEMLCYMEKSKHRKLHAELERKEKENEQSFE